jgi:NSS family neurotransmitter:Na+ symporter
MPSCLKIFQREDEAQQNEDKKAAPRDRWLSSVTFVIATIGSSVGLGNFWRFPYLTYKHGGAQFFLPYLLSVVFVGIPLLIMELGLGQKF